MNSLESLREHHGATHQDEAGRWYAPNEPMSHYGTALHFTGAWVCYTCGHLCECYDNESEVA